ncbi:MAG: CDP-diacylglycerol--glycerol-3-phosphate 3-phosphatidyltransferase [Verrucomicrobiales bacterium]|nr:CDP-diacylglycerol--glycerol-3-phosphate 3-phosphatidyltransferase [Verrucomicrobiales bacterium]
MNLPNKLTLGRLALTVLFVAVTSSPLGWGRGWAFTAGLLIFGVASLTDYLDGYLARKHNLITAFGKLMDPLADKVLLCAAFVLLTETPGPEGAGHLFPGWVTVTVLAREFLVTGLRLVASAQGSVLAADKLGKHKTIWQIITALYFLLFLSTGEPALSWLRPVFDVRLLGPGGLGMVLIAVTLLTTVVSGWAYFWKNRALAFREM